jgi:hypothetical protein
MAHHESEKQYEAGHIDNPSLAEADYDVDHGFTLAEQKAIVRRTDRRLVLICGAMYCVSLMDRTNMSSARIAGMNVELRLQGLDYNIANLVFFIPYIIFQPPSTIVVRKLGPRIHLAAITLLWGGVMIGMGFVQDFGQLAGMRVLLGFLEAGFFPSCVYLLSTWYTRCALPSLVVEKTLLTDKCRRGRQAVLSLLPAWLCRIRLFWHPRVWCM